MSLRTCSPGSGCCRLTTHCHVLLILGQCAVGQSCFGAQFSRHPQALLFRRPGALAAAPASRQEGRHLLLRWAGPMLQLTKNSRSRSMLA